MLSTTIEPSIDAQTATGRVNDEGDLQENQKKYVQDHSYGARYNPNHRLILINAPNAPPTLVNRPSNKEIAIITSAAYTCGANR